MTNPFHDNVTPLRTSVPVAPTQGTLALDLIGQPDPPDHVAPAPAALRTGDVVTIDLRVRRELEGWSRRYAQAAVEIVNGDRPASQLVRWTSSAVYQELARRAEVVARAGVHTAGQGRGRRPVVRPVVRSVRSCFLSPGTVEVSAHVRYGPRSRALALRFERVDDRWLCTALEFC